MAYTRDDYRKDLEIIRFGADGPELVEAQMRVKLYEAGRYEQLNALVDRGSEEDRAHDRLMDQLQKIDDDVSKSMQAWLNTPSNEHELQQQRHDEYVRKRNDAERQKAQLERDYYDRYYPSKSGGSVSGKLIGILMFIGGLAIPIGSCMQYGWDAPAGALWGFVVAAVGAFVFLINCDIN